MSRVLTREDKEILQMLRNGYKQQEDFFMEAIVEEPIMDLDDGFEGLSA